jgi:hypothetical protein
VRDGERLISFDGVSLAEVSSARPTSPRWTEMTLYRTDAGRYVLSKVGRTKVLHQIGCPGIMSKLNLYMDEFPNTIPEEGGFDFHTCVGASYYLDEILVEQTRYWVFIGETADAIVSALYNTKGDVRFLPRMSINLLEAAALRDNAIAEAYGNERV